jgi:NADPH2:quinone reductase
MLKIVVNEFGPPEALEAVEADAPEPADAHVVIRAEAIGVNFADVWARLGGGGEPPVTPGIEVAGTVDSSGSDRFAPGDRVVGTPFYTRGAYAELVSVPEELVFPVPEDVDFTMAAALPLNYLTAYSAVRQTARVREGDRVLVTSAAGGVGLAAVQLARDAGAEVYATASKPKHDFLSGQGVVGTVDSRSPRLAEEVKTLTDGGVDVVVDGVGDGGFRPSLDCLRHGGRVVAYGFTAGIQGKDEPVDDPEATLGAMSLPLLDLFDNSRSFMTADAGAEPPVLASWLDCLYQGVRDGAIAPHVDRVFPLTEAAAAHHYLQDRKNLGKVLLDPHA